MIGLFERFTERARQVIVLAQEEARKFKHNYIGTEHLLLGLCREEEGVAARVLEAQGVRADVVRQKIFEMVGEGVEGSEGQIPFTPRGKKVLELALRESLSLGHNYIGTEHLLLGLIREHEGVGMRIIVDIMEVPGGDPPLRATDVLREEIVRMLGGPKRKVDVEMEHGQKSKPQALEGKWLVEIHHTKLGPLIFSGFEEKPKQTFQGDDVNVISGALDEPVLIVNLRQSVVVNIRRKP